MNKFFKFLGIVLAFCLLCCGVFACGTTTTANAEELSYISLRINPEIELIIGEDDRVVGVNAINEDGETVLCELDLIGLTAEEAGEAFTAAATELGFIDVDGEATVYVLACGENEEFTKNLENKIKEKINGFFDEKGIFGKTVPEEVEEYAALAEEWGVSLKEARIVNRILELYPELTVEEVLELSNKEQMKLLKEDGEKNGLTAKERDEYGEKVRALKEEYAELFALGEELRELERTLRDKTLTEEERADLLAEYEEAKAEYDALKSAYLAAVESLKQAHREESKAHREEIKEEARERRVENEEKITKHEEKFQGNRERIENDIRDWREGK